MKGSVLDLVFILTFLMVGIMTVFVVAIMLVEFQTAWPFGGASATILTKGIAAITIFDQMLIFFAVAASIFSVVSAFFVRSHPIFFIFSLILTSMVIFLSAQLANALNAFMVSPPFLTIVNSFPMMVTLVQNFPLFTLLVSFLIIIATYAKGEEESGIRA